MNMASNSVDYIIRLVADGSELKEKLKAGKLLNKSEIAKLKQLIASVINDARKEANGLGTALANGLDVDTSHLEKTLQFISGIFEQLENTGNPMKDWAKTGKDVYSKFENLQNSVGTLAQNVKTLQTSLSTLTTAFEGFKQSFQSFHPTQFAGIADVVNNIVTSADGLVVVADGIKNIGEQAKKYDKEIGQINTMIDELSQKKVTISVSDVGKQLDELRRQVDSIEDEIDELSDRAGNAPEFSVEHKDLMVQLATQHQKRVKLYRQMAALDKHYKQKYDGESYFNVAGIITTPADVKKEAQAVYTKALAALEKEVSSQTIQTQTTPVNVALKLPTQGEIIKQLNDYIDGINARKGIHKIDVHFNPIDDAANVIEDKDKRGHGENHPPEYDVVTNSIVKKTNDRFGLIAEAIGTAQKDILKKTNTWRQDMINAMSIGKNDITLDFSKNIETSADILYNALQTYFQENQIELHINKEAFVQEVKDAMANGGISSGVLGGGGGTVNFDPNTLKTAIAEGLLAALTGDFTPSGAGSSVANGSSKKPEVVRLDPNSPYMKHMTEAVRGLADFASKETAPANKTKAFFNEILGDRDNPFDITTFTDASAMDVSVMLSDLMQKAGNTLLDKFDNLIKSAGKNRILQNFRGDLRELTYSQNSTQTTMDEEARRLGSIDVFKDISRKSKLLDIFNIKNPKWSEPIAEDLQEIFDIATASMDKTSSEYADASKKFGELKTIIANEDGLTGDQQKERLQTAVIAFRDSIRDTYNALYKYVNAFEMDVFVKGHKKPYRVSGRGSALRAQNAIGTDDANIQDVRIYKDVSTAALGTTRRGQELKMLRAPDNKSELIVQYPDRTDILNRDTSIDDWKQSDNTVQKWQAEGAAEDAEKRATEAAKLLAESEKRATAQAKADAELEEQLALKRAQKATLEQEIAQDKKFIAKNNKNAEKNAATRQKLIDSKAALDAAKREKEEADNLAEYWSKEDLSEWTTKNAENTKNLRKYQKWYSDPDKYHAEISREMYGASLRDYEYYANDAKSKLAIKNDEALEVDRELARLEKQKRQFAKNPRALQTIDAQIDEANKKKTQVLRDISALKSEADEYTRRVQEIRNKIKGSTDEDKSAFNADFERWVNGGYDDKGRPIGRIQYWQSEQNKLGANPKDASAQRAKAAEKAVQKAQKEYDKVVNSAQGQKVAQLDAVEQKVPQLEARVRELSNDIAEMETKQQHAKEQVPTDSAVADILKQRDEWQNKLAKDSASQKAIEKAVQDIVGAKGYQRQEYDIEYAQEDLAIVKQSHGANARAEYLESVAKNTVGDDSKAPETLTDAMKQTIVSLQDARKIYNTFFTEEIKQEQEKLSEIDSEIAELEKNLQGTQDDRAKNWINEDLKELRKKRQRQLDEYNLKLLDTMGLGTFKDKEGNVHIKTEADRQAEVHTRIQSAAQDKRSINPFVQEFYNKLLSHGSAQALEWAKTALPANVTAYTDQLTNFAQQDTELAKQLTPEVQVATEHMRELLQQRAQVWAEAIKEKMAAVESGNLSQEQSALAVQEIDNIFKLIGKAADAFSGLLDNSDYLDKKHDLKYQLDSNKINQQEYNKQLANLDKEREEYVRTSLLGDNASLLARQNDWKYSSYLTRDAAQDKKAIGDLDKQIEAALSKREPILKQKQSELLSKITDATQAGQSTEQYEKDLAAVNEELARYTQYHQQISNADIMNIFQDDIEFAEQYKAKLLEIIQLEQQADLAKAKGATNDELSAQYKAIDAKRNELQASVYGRLQTTQTGLLSEIETLAKSGKDTSKLESSLKEVNTQLVEYELNARRAEDIKLGGLIYNADVATMRVYEEETRKLIKAEQELALARKNGIAVEEALSAKRSQANKRARALNKAIQAQEDRDVANSPRAQALKYLTDTDKAYATALEQRSTLQRRIKAKEAQIDDIENDQKYSTSWQYKRHQRVVKNRFVDEYVGSEQYHADREAGKIHVKEMMRSYLAETAKMPKEVVDKIMEQLKLSTDKDGEKINPELLKDTYDRILRDDTEYKAYLSDREVEYNKILTASRGTVDTGDVNLNEIIDDLHKYRDALESGAEAIENAKQSNIRMIKYATDDEYEPLQQEMQRVEKQEMQRLRSRVDLDAMVAGFGDVMSDPRRTKSREATINNLKNQVLKAGGNQSEANFLAEQLDSIGDNALKDVHTWTKRFLPEIFGITEGQIRAQARQNLIAGEEKYAKWKTDELQGDYNRAKGRFDSAFGRETNKATDVFLNKYLSDFIVGLGNNSELQAAAGTKFNDIIDYFTSLMKEHVYNVVSNYASGLEVKDGFIGGINIREEVRKMLLGELDILQGKQPTIDTSIAHIEEQRKAAMKFGGIGYGEVVDADVLREQAILQSKLTAEQEKQKEITEQIVALEQTEDSEEELGRLNGALAQTNEYIARLQMLIDNRDTLMELQRQAKQDEKAEQQWTPEQQKLWFIKKIEDAKDNLKSEDSAVRAQAEQQIAKYSEMLSRLESKMAAEEAERRKDSSIIGVLTKALRDAFGGQGGFALDATGIASEATLAKILDVLTGLITAMGGTVTRDPEMEKKLARIRELEAKRVAATTYGATRDAKPTSDKADNTEKKEKKKREKKEIPDYIATARKFEKEELSKITTQEGLATIADQLVKDIGLAKEGTKEAIELQLKLQKVVNRSGDLYKASTGKKSYKAEEIGKLLGIGDKVDLRLSEKKAEEVAKASFAAVQKKAVQSSPDTNEFLFVSNTSDMFKALYEAIRLCKQGFDGLNGTLSVMNGQASVQSSATMTDAPQEDIGSDIAQALLQKAQSLGKFAMPLQNTEGMEFKQFLAEVHKYFELTNSRQMTPREMMFALRKDEATGNQFVSNQSGTVFGTYGQNNGATWEDGESPFHSHPYTNLFSKSDLRALQDEQSFGLMLPDYSYLTLSGMDKLDDSKLGEVHQLLQPRGEKHLRKLFGDAFVSAMEFPKVQSGLKALGIDVQRYSFDQNGNVSAFNDNISRDVVDAYNTLKQLVMHSVDTRTGFNSIEEQTAQSLADVIRNSDDYVRLNKNNSGMWSQQLSQRGFPGHSMIGFDNIGAMQEMSDKGLDLTRMYDDLKNLVGIMPETAATNIMRELFSQVDSGVASANLLNTTEMRNVVKHILGESMQPIGDSRSSDVLKSYGYVRDPHDKSQLLDVKKGDIATLTKSVGINLPKSIEDVEHIVDSMVAKYRDASLDDVSTNSHDAVRAFKEQYNDFLRALFPQSTNLYKTLDDIDAGYVSKKRVTDRISGLYGIKQTGIQSESDTSEETAQKWRRILTKEQDAFYESQLKYIPKDLVPDQAQAEAVQLKKTLDEMYTNGQSGTVDFMNTQVKLANLLSALRAKLGQGKTPADEWKQYVEGFLGNTDNVLFGNVGKRDYRSRLKALGVATETAKEPTKPAPSEGKPKEPDTKEEQQQADSAQQQAEAKEKEAAAETKITEEKQKQKDIGGSAPASGLTKAEQAELARLKEETRDYQPTVEGVDFARDSTLQEILTVVQKIKTEGVKKVSGGSGSGSTRNKNKTEADLIKERTLKQDEVVRGLAAGRGDLYDRYVAEVNALNKAVDDANKAKKDKKAVDINSVKVAAEKVTALTKNILKDAADWDYLTAQSGIKAFDYELPDGQTMTKELMEKAAAQTFDPVKEKYDFVGFDGTTLSYQLTDLEGNIRNVTMVWSEFNQQVAVTSDKAVNKLSEQAAHIDNLKNKFAEAQDLGYLDPKDAKLNEFNAQLQKIADTIKNGGTFEELEKMRANALKLGTEIDKTVNKNKRLYAGSTELGSAQRQKDKIVGLLGAEQFDDSDVQLLTKYKDAYAKLMDMYSGENGFKTLNTLYDPKNQEQLRQQAAQVQSLGKHLMNSANQAAKLKELVDQSGSYTDKNGNVFKLGKTKESLSATEVTNLNATMRDYVQNTLGQGQIENVKFNKTTQQLTYTFRTSKDTVADMVVQYNAATNALYAYNKQERESLTGFPALWQSLKSKTKSLWQYTMSITSIHRVLSELRKGVQYIREIDSALTELKKVTDETEETYDRFLDTASKTASKVGSTIKEVVSSTADWARLGYSLEDAATLAENTSVLLNVSEFSSIEDATSALTSTLQAFSYTAEQSLYVVDVMNEVKFLASLYSDVYDKDGYIGKTLGTDNSEERF